MKRIHGERNEALCSKLLTENIYRDWVITTAFYSAIHFIEDKLFPLEHDDNLFEDIGELRVHLEVPSKHVARKELVALYLNDQVSNYDFLDKNCRNARYVSYEVSQKKAQTAFQRLNQIKTRCSE